MDTYAGGIKTNYQFNHATLDIAQQKIDELVLLTDKASVDTMRSLLSLYELKDRLEVARVLIQHMKARKETRWNSFCENMDYKEVNDAYLNYINSINNNGKIEIIQRPLVARGEVYEHKN
jgi:adenylylsulfate reductase subunit A